LNVNDLPIPEAAQHYIDQGFRVIPMWGVDPHGRCCCGGTLPTGKPCNAGKHCPDIVEEMWKDGHRFTAGHFLRQDNIAIALGPWQPGKWLVCLDFDGPAEPSSFFRDLPPTRSQKSPRGQHLFFAVREYEPLGNWVDCLQTKYTSGTGVDVRYARGKINVAPSRSAFGRYEWKEWCDPAELPVSVIHRILSERRRRGLPVLKRWEREGKRP
jgi:hypothetical protein